MRPAWIQDYLRIPFLERGRTRAGLDCYGLVRLIFQEQRGIELPSYAEDYATTADVDEITALVRGEVASQWQTVPVTEARLFDVAILRILGEPIHVGLVVDASEFLHIRRGIWCSVERWESVIWKHRLVSVVRWHPHASVERAQPATDGGHLRLIACPHLAYEHDKIDRYVPAGPTVAEHLRAIGWKLDTLHARVLIDGEFIEQARWEYAVPRAGQSFVTRLIPMEGGGKDVLRIVAMLAIVVAAVFTAGGALAALPGLGALTAGSLAANLAAAAISVAGSLAISLIPPARPRLNELSGDNFSPTLSLTGSSNQFAPYAPIPRVYGTHRIYPPLASRTFTEIVGSDQYLRLLFCFGYGPLELKDFRIGQTPLDQFDGVELEIRYGYPDDTPLTLFPNDVFEESLSILLSSAFETRNSQPDAKELSVDITWPQGVGQNSQVHGLIAWRVSIVVEYRKVGDVTWIPVDNQNVTATVATNMSGANNDLVFTAREAGASGNNIVVTYARTSVFRVLTSSTTLRGSQVISGRTITVHVIQGVTTGAQIKAGIEANVIANSWVSVTHKGSDNGTGTFTFTLIEHGKGSSIRHQLAGGTNVVFALVAQGPTSNQLRLSRRWLVPEIAEYEVRVRKVLPDPPWEDSQFFLDTAFWTVLRTIQTNPPAVQDGLAFAALRIKATGQLNGTVDQFSAIATSILLDWNGTEWLEAPTANPASIYRDVLQGSANRRPKTDAQLDLPQIEAFHEKCTAEAFAFNAVIDFRTTVKQLRQDVLAAGRGAFHLRDMKYSVLFETVQPVGVAVITPRNSSSFTWTKRFVDIPHALRIRYVDEDSDYRQNERIVYADGYDANTATIFQDGDAGLGTTHATQVWKLKKRELAEAALRADEYSVKMDFEHLQFTRGDRVELQHDSVLAALSSARVTEGVIDGSDLITQLTLDAPVIMEAGKEYGVRVWKGIGGSCVGKCVTVAGQFSVLAFDPPMPESVGVAIGDLLTFGLFGQESVACVVKSIRPGADYAATVTLVDYAPAIMTADSVPIPPYEGHVTNPQVDRFIISPPIVDRVQSDETVLLRALDGALQSRILITVSFASGFQIPVDRLEAQFRPSNSESPWTQLGVAVDGTTHEISLSPVEDGVSYDFRLRAVDTRTGATSGWNATQGHTVIGKTSPPADVEVVVIEGDRLRWNYANPPVDLAGFLVRYRSGIEAFWDSAAPAHDNLLLTTDFTIFRGIGPMTFMVKAVDMSGNQSVTPGRVTINFGAPLPENIVIEDNHRTLGWPGTKTNGTVSANQLRANNSTPFWTVDSARFWSEDPSTLMWPGVSDIWLPMSYEFFFSPPPDLLEATLKLLHQIEGVWSIQYRSDSTALMWHEDDSVLMWGSNSNPMWSARGPYIQWPGQLTPLTHQAYQLRITTEAGLHRGILDQLSVFLDLATLEEALNDIVIAPGGTRLPLTKTFRQIFSVRPDLQDDGGPAAYVKVMDKNVDLHPLVAAFDSSDVTTGALIDAVVSGI